MSKPRQLRVAVIGAGASGIATAVRLREMGIDDVLIFEKATDLGGTWRENRYPGVACDVPSHLYRLSFAPNPDWSRRYSPGAEIQAYLHDVAERFGVTPLIRFGEEVTALAREGGQWRLTTNGGDRGLFDVVISAVGVLHHPAYPDIAGLGDFSGPCFHTARWDDSVDLAGKRIGIIGTGSTATQIVCATVGKVAHLTLFQRTPQWIMPQPNPPISEARKAEYRANPALMEERYREIAAIFNGAFCSAVAGTNPEAYAAMEKACADNLATVRDPALRAKLTPDYRLGCKRLIVSDSFYEAIQQPNAELVTTPIRLVEGEGVRTADDRLHQLDCIVLATGFDPHRLFRPMEVTNAEGRTLGEVWEHENFAYRAVAVPEFPNFFILGGPNSPIGNFSFLMTAERQLDYVLQLIALLRSGEAREIAPGSAATEAWNAAIRQGMQGSIWASGCRSWYQDRNGNVASFPWAYDVFEREMATPRLEDFQIVR